MNFENFTYYILGYLACLLITSERFNNFLEKVTDKLTKIIRKK